MAAREHEVLELMACGEANQRAGRAARRNDEWLVGPSYISQGSMASLYETQTDTTPSPRSEEEEVAELAAA